MTVEEILRSKDIAYIPKGKDFVVRCLHPDHDDRNPSMRIDQVTGIFNCFSCGFKGNLFTHFGQKANKMEIKRQLLKKKIDEVDAIHKNESDYIATKQGEGEWDDYLPDIDDMDY